MVQDNSSTIDNINALADRANGTLSLIEEALGTAQAEGEINDAEQIFQLVQTALANLGLIPSAEGNPSTESLQVAVNEQVALAKESVDEHAALAKADIDTHAAMARAGVDAHIAIANASIDSHVAAATAKFDQHAAAVVTQAIQDNIYFIVSAVEDAMRRRGY